MKYKEMLHNDYLAYEIPYTWTMEDMGDSVLCYDEKKGQGVITYSCYDLIDDDRELTVRVIEMGNKFIEQANIKIDNSYIQDTTKSNKLFLYATGTDDDGFVKIWLVAKKLKVIVVTYNADKKTSELKVVDKIVDSMMFITDN